MKCSVYHSIDFLCELGNWEVITSNPNATQEFIHLSHTLLELGGNGNNSPMLTLRCCHVAGSNVLRNETTLTIDIIDENDEVPEFSQPEYHVEVRENNAINMTLLDMEATDRFVPHLTV